uniref:CRAL-TRIO domain-containing protein n=1 Tax=Panagrolaimus davidi TaxID=227884 RepID=A0A914P5Z0_9BILA
MTKFATTQHGEPLSQESKKLVNEVRLRLTQPLHPNFNTDFNIYRFVLNAERQYSKTKDIIEAAAKGVNNHLRLRKCLHLDEMEDVPFSKNPIFVNRYLPQGEIRKETDIQGRPLWFVEYATITIEGIAHSIRSSAAIRYQFWQFEHMLRHVMKQEEQTGKLSSLRHIVDLTGYEINPFMMIFVSSGTLSYYSNLLHYENFPELVYPVEIVNVTKWVHMPYKLVKTMMPAGFTDRFRLYDNQFLDTLGKEMSIEDIPESLGGKNKEIKCIPAVHIAQEDYWKPPSDLLLTLLEPFHVSAKKQKFFKIEIPENQQRKTLKTETKEMVLPFVKITAKFVHEFDYLDLEKPGSYYLLFCNRHSWLHRRNLDALIQVSNVDGSEPKRIFFDGTQSSMSEEESIMKILNLREFKD